MLDQQPHTHTKSGDEPDFFLRKSYVDSLVTDCLEISAHFKERCGVLSVGIVYGFGLNPATTVPLPAVRDGQRSRRAEHDAVDFPLHP